MQIELKDARPGDFLLWPMGGGDVILSDILAAFYSDWRARPNSEKKWHGGQIVNVLDDDKDQLSLQESEIVKIITFQAVGGNAGNRTVAYPSLDSLAATGATAYRWFKFFDQARSDAYVDRYNGRPYSIADYPLTGAGGISMKLFNRPQSFELYGMMCWRQMMRYSSWMGREILPREVPPLINFIQMELETV
jgi:hypothetical protein